MKWFAEDADYNHILTRKHAHRIPLGQYQEDPGASIIGQENIQYNG